MNWRALADTKIMPESEAAFLSLAQNTDIVFRLGWHVLKNRRYETRQLLTEARDDAEREFLSQGAWRDLARTTVGVYVLRERLSKILFDQIQAEMPTLIEDLEGKLSQRRSTLAKFGPSRGSSDQQRLFLLQVSQEYQAISKAALDGSYEHGFFDEARSTNGYSKRFRAVIQNLNGDFARSKRLRGHQH